jgi:hypothetical protein
MDHVQRAIGGGGAESTAHLPPELNVYGGAFDQYGAWQYDAPYGYVWYPTVAADWRPYYYGYWSSVPTYGPTWIGVDAWSWPTHHYGRWGLRAQSLVLDSGSHLGRRLGLVGVGARAM